MNVLDAYYHTVHDYAGGPEALAPRLGMSAQVLRNKANQNNEQNKPLLIEADRMMGITGDYRILHELARNHSHVCTPIDPSKPIGDAALIDLVAGSMKGGGDVGAAVMTALSDRRVTREEAENVKRAVYAAVQQLQSLAIGIQQLVDEQ